MFKSCAGDAILCGMFQHSQEVSVDVNFLVGIAVVGGLCCLCNSFGFAELDLSGCGNVSFWVGSEVDLYLPHGNCSLGAPAVQA